jgi:cytochrome c-type biogenesis protein CcmH
MMLWTLFALMTAAAIFAVLWPLARRRGAAPSGSDVVVYRDQLDEIERDRAAGTIGAAEAEAARVEVSRRLIAAVDATPGGAREEQNDKPLWRRRLAAAAVLVAMPVGALGLYLALGSPNIPGQPLAERIAQAHGSDPSIAALLDRVEVHLAQNPNDGRGWEVIAPVYMRLGRYTDAITAHRNALRLLGPTAARLGDLGEAIVMANDGIVTAEAKGLFDRAAGLDPDDVMAKYYLGLAAKQDGRRDDAEKAWRELLARAPQDAPWIALVQSALARIDEKTSSPAPDNDVAGKAPPDHGSAAIKDMVDRLAARLKKDGSDPDGWVKLVRSYRVLGDNDKAGAALADARRALADDANKLQQFNETLKRFETSGNAEDGPAVAAASQPSDQSGEMIRGMVDRLAARLKKDGSDPDGWARLVRSYRVIGDNDKAGAALADARRALADDANKLQQLNAALTALEAASNANGDPARAPAAPAAPAAAAAAQPSDQNGQMIRGMVDRLAARLKQDGSDLDGWIRLVRSYVVLGEVENARAAVTDGRSALAGDADKLRKFDEAVKELGVKS